MTARNMILFIFIVIAVILPTVHSSLQITDHEFPLMLYSKLISEEHFIPRCPLVVVLPRAEEVSSKQEVGYLIQELHKSVRWPILVYNDSNEMNGFMYPEIHQHCSYIVLISKTCALWEYHFPIFWQQLDELSEDNSMKHPWNPRTKFLVPLMSKCKHLKNTHISKFILARLWIHKVMNATLLFLKSNKQAGTDF